MRGRTFEKPTVRKVLARTREDLPEKITTDFIIYLIGKNLVVPVVSSYSSAVNVVENPRYNWLPYFQKYLKFQENNQII